MVLIQLLLPIGASGDPAMTALAETRRELVDRFKGVTAYVRSPATGLWTAPDGHTEADDVVMVEVAGATRRDAGRGGEMSKPFAIVTGASSGIGLELATICAQEGFDLLIAADRPEIETAADRCRECGAAVQVDSFSFALRAELKDTGVTVTCLMPGATETDFFERADMLDTKVGQDPKDDPADVARLGFDAMMRGDGDIVSGWKNKLQTAMANVTLAGVLAEQHRKMAEPGSAKKAKS
jgi:hypothetical protein